MTVARTLSLLVIFLVVSVPSLASQQDSSILSDLSVEVEEALAAERESGRHAGDTLHALLPDLLAHTFDHLLHHVELLDQAIDILNRVAAALRDAQPARSVQ